jgi:hypothetical protein
MTQPHAAVLSGGTNVDGTGSPSYRGDVLIGGDRITGVGSLLRILEPGDRLALKDLLPIVESLQASSSLARCSG